MKFNRLHGGSALFLYLFFITSCFHCTTTVAKQTEGPYQNLEGYYVDMKDDTSFVTLKIPMYLEEPDYVLLQNNVKYLDQSGEDQKLKPKTTKGFGFAFHNELIRMVSFKTEFLHLLDNEDSKLPDDNFKLFIRYSFPSPRQGLFLRSLLATMTKEPLSKYYLYQHGNSKLAPFNSAVGLNKLNKRLVDKQEK